MLLTRPPKSSAGATTYPKKSDKWSIRENFVPWEVLTHGWRHVSFKDLKCNAQNVRRGDGKAALRQTVFALKTGELEALIKKASQSKPVEVAYLWYRCKSRENIRRVLQEFYRWAVPSVGISNLLNKIPSPAELAAQYMQSIYEDPGTGSDHVRDDLSLLVSPGAIKAACKNGRPGVIYSWADVVYIRAMAYCFVKQISQARRFLKNAKFDGRDARANISLDFLGGQGYAEILQDVGPGDEGDPQTSQGDNRVAGILAGKLLDVSASYVNRVFYSKAPRF
jgi:hypothetical protein